MRIKIDHAELSIIIPMYNGSATIARAIESLKCQNVQRWEAIVIDDGSTDLGTGREIVSSLAAVDSRIKLVCQANGGVCRARNRGLDEATGEYILFMDADDWMLPGGVDALLQVAKSGGTGAAVGTFEMVGAESNLLSIEGPWSEEITHNHLLGGIFMTTHGHVVARTFYEPMNGMSALRFDPELKLIEDTDLWIKLAERGVRWRNCHQTVCAYLMRSDSRSVSFESMFEHASLVYKGAFARAASTRDGSGALDISPRRLNGVLAGAAVGYATRLALSKAGAIAEARSLLSRSPAFMQFEPMRLARASRHAVMFALGAAPVVPQVGEQPVWWASLNEWWSVLQVDGWIKSGTARDIAAEFVAPVAPVAPISVPSKVPAERVA